MSIKPQIAGSDMYMIRLKCRCLKYSRVRRKRSDMYMMRLKYHDYPNTVNSKKMVHYKITLKSEHPSNTLTIQIKWDSTNIEGYGNHIMFQRPGYYLSATFLFKKHLYFTGGYHLQSFRL